MLKLTLNKKLNDTHFGAIGVDVDNAGNVKAQADLLVKHIGDNQVVLDLDSRLKQSILNGKEVLSYANAKPSAVSELKEGSEVQFEKVWLSLKK